MTIVVSDTGPILHLWEIDALDLLSFVGSVYITEEINNELESHIKDWKSIKPKFVSIKKLSEKSSKDARSFAILAGIHEAEASAILLAHNIKADWLLTDDADARESGSSHGLEIHGTLGVILWAALKGHINKEPAMQLIKNLKDNSSLWVSQKVLDVAYEALYMMFA